MSAIITEPLLDENQVEENAFGHDEVGEHAVAAKPAAGNPDDLGQIALVCEHRSSKRRPAVLRDSGRERFDYCAQPMPAGSGNSCGADSCGADSCGDDDNAQAWRSYELQRVQARRPGRPAKLLDMRACKRPLKTFVNPDLENEFLSYCQMASPVFLSAAKLEARRQELLKVCSDYIHLPEFDMPDAEQRLCGSTLLEPVGELDEAMQPGLEDLMFARLCTRRLLGKGEESSAVKRIHFFKMRAHQLLNRPGADQWTVARAEGLIRAAYWHRSLVIQSNVRLVVSIVRKLPISPYYYDEMVSDGIVGMVRALDRFDPSRGYRFCTYATTVIRRECFEHIQDRKAHRKRFGSSAALTILNSVRGLAEVPGDRTHWITWRRKLIGLMSQLSTREQIVIRARYCLEESEQISTLQKLADTLKLSKERIRQIEKNALAKLKSLAATCDFSDDEDELEMDLSAVDTDSDFGNRFLEDDED